MSEKKETVMIEVPKAWANKVRKFIESVEAAKPDTRGGRAVDYAAYEREVEKSAGELEKEAHRVLLQELDIDAAQVLISGRLSSAVLATQAAMAEASTIVLDGFSLRSDVATIRFPDRYMDERGQSMWDTVQRLIDRRAGAHPYTTTSASM